MGIERKVVCDKCNTVINNTKGVENPNGFSIIGNIHVAEDTEHNGIGGGLIGNSFPTHGDDFCVDDIKVFHYHRECFAAILGLKLVALRN